MSSTGEPLDPPTKDEFAHVLLQALRDAGEDRPAEVNSELFVLQFEKKGSRPGNTLFLGNFYDEHCSLDPEDRPGHLEHVIRAIASSEMKIPEEFDDAKMDLLPVVRTRSFLENASLQGLIEHGKPADVPSYPIGDHLAINLVYDMPLTMVSVSQSVIDDWGVTYYEALEIARENLKEREFRIATMDDRIYLTMTQDNYDASRLLFLDIIYQLKVEGDYVAMVPNRDKLLITGSEDMVGLGLMVSLAEQALDEPRPMYAIPLILDGEDWVSWTVPDEHAMYPEFHKLELRSLSPDYAHQKELLERLHEKEDIDVFVATHTVGEMDEKAISYCVWVEDVETLLPVADLVVFVAEDEVVGRANWDRVREVMGEQMEDEGLYPIRYHVRDFPTEEQFAAMDLVE